VVRFTSALPCASKWEVANAGLDGGLACSNCCSARAIAPACSTRRMPRVMDIQLMPGVCKQTCGAGLAPLHQQRHDGAGRSFCRGTTRARRSGWPAKTLPRVVHPAVRRSQRAAGRATSSGQSVGRERRECRHGVDNPRRGPSAPPQSPQTVRPCGMSRSKPTFQVAGACAQRQQAALQPRGR
jgi:hypothetical protein